MLSIPVPGFADLSLTHLVSDYNGTLALDGELLPGVTQRLAALVQREGGAVETATSADLLSTSVNDALDLLLHPKRLIASLRS